MMSVLSITITKKVVPMCAALGQAPNQSKCVNNHEMSATTFDGLAMGNVWLQKQTKLTKTRYQKLEGVPQEMKRSFGINKLNVLN